MIHVSRDAGRTLRAFYVCLSAGCLHHGGSSARTLGGRSARTSQGLQDRNTQDSGISLRASENSGTRCAVTETAVSDDGGDSAAPLDGSQRSKDDSLAMSADGTTKFGDSGRQDLGLGIGAGGGVMQERRWITFGCANSEDKYQSGLMKNNGQQPASSTHVSAPMGPGFQGRKGSVTTTKNDKSQNRLDHHHFWRGPSIAIVDPHAGRRRELVVRWAPRRGMTGGCRHRRLATVPVPQIGDRMRSRFFGLRRIMDILPRVGSWRIELNATTRFPEFR